MHKALQTAERIAMVSGEIVHATWLRHVRSLTNGGQVDLYRTNSGRLVVCTSISGSGQIPQVDPDSTPANYGHYA